MTSRSPMPPRTPLARMAASSSGSLRCRPGRPVRRPARLPVEVAAAEVVEPEGHGCRARREQVGRALGAVRQLLLRLECLRRSRGRAGRPMTDTTRTRGDCPVPAPTRRHSRRRWRAGSPASMPGARDPSATSSSGDRARSTARRGTRPGQRSTNGTHRQIRHPAPEGSQARRARGPGRRGPRSGAPRLPRRSRGSREAPRARSRGSSRSGLSRPVARRRPPTRARRAMMATRTATISRTGSGSPHPLPLSRTTLYRMTI